jgi:hypothetical protein
MASHRSVCWRRNASSSPRSAPSRRHTQHFW